MFVCSLLLQIRQLIGLTLMKNFLSTYTVKMKKTNLKQRKSLGNCYHLNQILLLMLSSAPVLFLDSSSF